MKSLSPITDSSFPLREKPANLEIVSPRSDDTVLVKIEGFNQYREKVVEHVNISKETYEEMMKAGWFKKQQGGD